MMIRLNSGDKIKMIARCWDCKKDFNFDKLKFVEYKNTFVPKCKRCLNGT